MNCDGQFFLSFWSIFSPLSTFSFFQYFDFSGCQGWGSLDNPKNQIVGKMKKMATDIIILHMRTINDNQLMYRSTDMKRDGQNFLSFRTVFYFFLPP